MDVDSDSSDEEVITAYYYYRRNKKNRRFWVHPYIEKNFHHRLFIAARELNLSDTKFLCFYRMSKESYLYLVNLISPAINKRDTNMRECVNAEERILITLRGQLKGQLTRFSTYVNKDSVDPIEIKCRSKRMEELWSEFDQVQSKIESFENETDDYRIEFEEIYFSAIALALKLAPIDVPKFSGAYEEWSAFHDIYMAMIHNNPGIDDIQRFFHLRSCLKDEAAQVIMYIETTAANYNVAWNSVVSRYNNKKVLVQSHTKELFDIPAINEEAVQLRKLVDQLNGHINALEALGEKPREWGSILLHLIATKLDSSTLKAWETVSPKNEIPKVQVLLEFLEKRFKIKVKLN
ncbi:uncharacterized protein LOC112593474 [Melanaphis sacchari]|uniref:uncharacterized protein LOC112593474 n=1 Tax=Melanaphis sacchari TaxID=742174 RepID=UPI000DC1595D|nr:uncharacterized protein LOC112593474 [Melanaphis sacchari]